MLSVRARLLDPIRAARCDTFNMWPLNHRRSPCTHVVMRCTFVLCTHARSARCYQPTFTLNAVRLSCSGSHAIECASATHVCMCARTGRDAIILLSHRQCIGLSLCDRMLRLVAGTLIFLIAPLCFCGFLCPVRLYSPHSSHCLFQSSSASVCVHSLHSDHMCACGSRCLGMSECMAAVMLLVVVDVCRTHTQRGSRFTLNAALKLSGTAKNIGSEPLISP